jgi:hypothetical protein
VAKKARSKNPLLLEFGRRLEELRGTRTREQVSVRLRELGVPLGGSTLAQYEGGSVWAPDPGVLWGLAQIYRVEHEDIVTLLRENRRRALRADSAHAQRNKDVTSSVTKAGIPSGLQPSTHPVQPGGDTRVGSPSASSHSSELPDLFHAAAQLHTAAESVSAVAQYLVSLGHRRPDPASLREASRGAVGHPRVRRPAPRKRKTS